MIQLHDNETVLLKRRRHWYVIAGQSTGLVVGFLTPVFLFIAALAHETAQSFVQEFLGVILLGLGAWLLVLWTVFFVLWTNYYLDILLVTNLRIIDIEQHGLFARDIAEVSLGNVQDIKVEVLGVLPSLLNFGTIHIQTAGEAKEVVVHNVPKPHEVRKTISRHHHKKTSAEFSTHARGQQGPRP